MINGWVDKGIFGEYLNPIQCIETGLFALHWKRYSMAVEWLETGRKLINDNIQHVNNGLSQEITKDLVTQFIKVAVQEVKD